MEQTIRLTDWSEGSGCGCKIAPAVLDQILQASGSFSQKDPNLLVGNSSKDDAAVYQVSEDLALINTVDFFTPIVDDAFDFGRIAATNAISDVYAMGGKPLFANAILSWPVEKLAPELAAKVLEGAKLACSKAGIELAGGHSIAAKDPIFGLSVNGIIHPRKIKKNSGSKEGDLLFLTKPLGIGVLATALKRQKINPKDYQNLVEVACQLNKIGEVLGNHEEVHALTDVTGFGLIGHLSEMLGTSFLNAQVNLPSQAVLPKAQSLFGSGKRTSADARNRDALDREVLGLTQSHSQAALFDPQTNGGLLASIAPEFEIQLVEQGFITVGKVVTGSGKIEVLSN